MYECVWKPYEVFGMEPNEIAAYWGQENLQRWRVQSVSGLAIPPASKEFLINIGLPAPGRRIATYYDLSWDEALPLIPDAPARRLLGRNHGRAAIVIDEECGGCVRWLADTYAIERYVNASVEQFAASLIEWDKFSATSKSYDDPQTQVAVTALWKRLKEIDTSAIQDPESKWSSTIFEMRIEI